MFELIMSISPPPPPFPQVQTTLRMQFVQEFYQV